MILKVSEDKTDTKSLLGRIPFPINVGSSSHDDNQSIPDTNRIKLNVLNEKMLIKKCEIFSDL